MQENGQGNLIDVPYYVIVYCQNRYSEVVEYLNERQLRKAYRDKECRIKVKGNEGGLTKCVIKRPVKPLTVLRNPMLLYAAELEYRTWGVMHRISLHEARYLFVDTYPETNNVAQPNSVLKLIKEKKGALKLSLSQLCEIADERKIGRDICSA